MNSQSAGFVLTRISTVRDVINSCIINSRLKTTNLADIFYSQHQQLVSKHRSRVRWLCNWSSYVDTLLRTFSWHSKATSSHKSTVLTITRPWERRVFTAIVLPFIQRDLGNLSLTHWRSRKTQNRSHDDPIKRYLSYDDGKCLSWQTSLINDIVRKCRPTNRQKIFGRRIN